MVQKVFNEKTKDNHYFPFSYPGATFEDSYYPEVITIDSYYCLFPNFLCIKSLWCIHVQTQTYTISYVHFPLYNYPWKSKSYSEPKVTLSSLSILSFLVLSGKCHFHPSRCLGQKYWLLYSFPLCVQFIRKSFGVCVQSISRVHQLSPSLLLPP